MVVPFAGLWSPNPCSLISWPGQRSMTASNPPILREATCEITWWFEAHSKRRPFLSCLGLLKSISGQGLYLSWASTNWDTRSIKISMGAVPFASLHACLNAAEFSFGIGKGFSKPCSSAVHSQNRPAVERISLISALVWWEPPLKGLSGLLLLIWLAYALAVWSTQRSMRDSLIGPPCPTLSSARQLSSQVVSSAVPAGLRVCGSISAPVLHTR